MISLAPMRNQDEQRAAAHQEELRVGQHVLYTDRAAETTHTVRIAHIERAVAAGEEPFYTVQLPNGSERQTERGRLRSLSSADKPVLSKDELRRRRLARLDRSPSPAAGTARGRS